MSRYLEAFRLCRGEWEIAIFDQERVQGRS